MWIDAGRTCSTDDNNRSIDWKNGLVTVTVSLIFNIVTQYIIHNALRDA